MTTTGSKPAKDTSGHGVHNLGYRSWNGRLSPGWTRWLVIASVGFVRSWKSMWLRRMLFFAWLPTLGFGLGFFLWEQSALHPEWRQGLTQSLRGAPSTPEFDAIRTSVATGDLDVGRHSVWAWLLQSFFRRTQGVVMVFVVGMIFPPLISQDIRSRAFLLYFSRPLTRREYVLGKLATLWAYQALVSTIPALGLYLMGLLLSPNLNVVNATWDIPLRVLAGSVVLMLPTSVFALCLSSLTQESRYAGFAWFAVWILGFFTYLAATSQEATRQAEQFRDTGRVEWTESEWTHLSPYHTLARVQTWIFGFSDFRDVMISVLILLLVTAISLVILVRRISAPMRV